MKKSGIDPKKAPQVRHFWWRKKKFTRNIFLKNIHDFSPQICLLVIIIIGWIDVKFSLSLTHSVAYRIKVVNIEMTAPMMYDCVAAALGKINFYNNSFFLEAFFMPVACCTFLKLFLTNKLKLFCCTFNRYFIINGVECEQFE